MNLKILTNSLHLQLQLIHLTYNIFKFKCKPNDATTSRYENKSEINLCRLNLIELPFLSIISDVLKIIIMNIS